MTITDIIREFAKFGFTDTPLSICEMDQCIAWGFTMDMIYGLGCNMASGWRFNEVIDLYFIEMEEMDKYA